MSYAVDVMALPVVGLVDVRDLLGRSWARGHTSELLAAVGVDDAGARGASVERWTARTACPAMIVLVPRWTLPAMLSPQHPLLRAPHVAVVVDERASAAPKQSYDQELVALDDADIARALGAKPRVAWDGSAASADAVRALVDDLQRIAGADPARTAPQSTAPLSSPVSPLSLPSSTPWIPLDELDHWERRRLGARVCVRDGRALFIFVGGAAGARDLVSGEIARFPVLEDDRLAIELDSRHAVVVRANPGMSTLIDVSTGNTRAHCAVGGFPFAFSGNLAAVGWRCTFDWLGVDIEHGMGGAVVDAKLAWLASCAHEWPLGHAKKLWGHHNNEPESLQIAADAGAYVSTFEHDVVVAGAIPYRWRRAGALAVVDWPPEDSLRRLLFVPDWTHAPGAVASERAALEEEDVRGSAPVFVVGPDDEHRYAVALDREVWCLDSNTSARCVGGPADGYAVYDAAHRLVRRGHGRLVGGARTLVILDEDDVLHRESFDGTGRTSLGPLAGAGTGGDGDISVSGVERSYALGAIDRVLLVSEAGAAVRLV